MVCLSDEDVVARVKEITGGVGAWGVMECMCGDMVRKMCQASRIGGKVRGHNLTRTSCFRNRSCPLLMSIVSGAHAGG